MAGSCLDFVQIEPVLLYIQAFTLRPNTTFKHSVLMRPPS